MKTEQLTFELVWINLSRNLLAVVMPNLRNIETNNVVYIIMNSQSFSL